MEGLVTRPRSHEELQVCLDDLKQLISKGGYSLDAFFYESVGSTNDEAKSLRAPALIIALEQTQGKGRMGRRWSSIRDQGLYFSLRLEPKMSPELMPAITQLTALAVARVLGEKALIKWPNDIYIGDKKICGILCEMTLLGETIDALVIGVGLNLRPVEVEGRLTTSIEEEQLDLTRMSFLEHFLEQFYSLYDHFIEVESLESWMDEINQKSYLMHRSVRTEDGKNYTFQGISPEGDALLRHGDETRKVFFGELSLKVEP